MAPLPEAAAADVTRPTPRWLHSPGFEHATDRARLNAVPHCLSALGAGPRAAFRYLTGVLYGTSAGSGLGASVRGLATQASASSRAIL